ncbi:hypothetical protein [Bradyrhizobium iriomotense]|uniref:Uncharacterized protein n=1 Tax=Bradyrhizobium iriomotense TaxID=441950 RepID=A0ABQ6AU45_9BRAD|nr:hypothetical protein [Bradyrhizobium iriomotense]GLR85083.1 hypothetical protein GCM10007857_17930 [Bradyrhizobium iriomotense]
MSMLTHRFEHFPHSPAERSSLATRLTPAHRKAIRRIGLRVLAILSMGSVLTALIALKTVIFMWRFHF